MSVESESHKNSMHEAVRLYLWYSESPFSYHRGKASKVDAERQLYLIGYHHAEMIKTQ